MNDFDEFLQEGIKESSEETGADIVLATHAGMIFRGIFAQESQDFNQELEGFSESIEETLVLDRKTIDSKNLGAPRPNTIVTSGSERWHINSVSKDESSYMLSLVKIDKENE
jgi:hypothetical protein